MEKINAVVVLYNPQEDIVENIKTYIDDVEKLYVVDNSSTKNTKLLGQILNNKKSIYIDNYENKGVAHALNLGAKEALLNNATWLLTMDQDSSFKKNDLAKMIEWTINNNIDLIGIISPMHSQKEINRYSSKYDLNTMTSGNLLNLKVYDKIGGFEEKLFIDSVDTEFCLRMNFHGYKIHRFKSILLKHNVGNQRKVNIFFISFFLREHSALRRYYMIRNKLYTWRRWGKSFPLYIIHQKLSTMFEIAKILLLEQDKISKLKMIYRGYEDYKEDRYGKYGEK